MTDKISSLERDCIACPVAWIGEITDGRKIYIRYRGGIFQVREGNKEYPKNVEYEESFGDRFDGHLTQLEMRKKLNKLGYEFEQPFPPEFYGIPTEDCSFLLIGDWFDKMYCTDCEWSIEEGEQEDIEYETAVPNYCPNCGEDIEVNKSTPERLRRLFHEE